MVATIFSFLASGARLKNVIIYTAATCKQLQLAQAHRAQCPITGRSAWGMEQSTSHKRTSAQMCMDGINASFVTPVNPLFCGIVAFVGVGLCWRLFAYKVCISVVSSLSDERGPGQSSGRYRFLGIYFATILGISYGMGNIYQLWFAY